MDKMKDGKELYYKSLNKPIPATLKEIQSLKANHHHKRSIDSLSNIELEIENEV